MIEITQYLRPHGHTTTIEATFEDPEDERKARAVQEYGWKFTAEVLTTGQVSFAVEGFTKEDPEERDLFNRIARNDPSAQGVFNKMVRDAYNFMLIDVEM